MDDKTLSKLVEILEDIKEAKSWGDIDRVQQRLQKIIDEA